MYADINGSKTEQEAHLALSEPHVSTRKTLENTL